MKIYQSGSYSVKIYIAGAMNIIEQACREHVVKGLCVNIKPNKYIYTYGEETGAEIELINYPKYPKSNEEIWVEAVCLGNKLMSALFCGSFTVMDGEKAITYDRRI